MTSTQSHGPKIDAESQQRRWDSCGRNSKLLSTSYGVGSPSGVGAPAARAQKMAETLGRGGGEKILSPGIFIGVIALLPRIDATALLRLF